MHVVTFYSFKGGVGRTMALVNVAVELAERGKRVLVVDFDLEAPGVQTYTPFLNGGKNRGIVEYVTQYMFSGEAPDAREFILENSINGKSIWLMPSGFQDEEYARRLNSIDWLKLYKDYNGYLMFEDLKQQWQSVLHFDYVLIDSRTGHTDVGGICTRQLPDAAVLMFLPNDQNIAGIETVVRNIRGEVNSPRNKSIYCHFCPSNVPDLDDEELVLQRQLRNAEQRLGYTEPAAVIHHYNSLALLDQAVFVKDRPRTHLAEEYRQLVEAVVAENLEDKSGAFSKLSRIRESLPYSETTQPLEVEEVLKAIFKFHPNDGKIAWLASQIYNSIGNSDGELAQLNISIQNNVNEARARFRRAMLLAREGETETVSEDLRFVINSSEARVSDIASSIRRLRRFDKNWLEVVAASPAIKKLQGEEKARIVDVLTRDRLGAQLAAKLILGDWEHDKTSLESNNDLAMALIAAGEYQKAMELLGDKAEILDCQDVEPVFNFACAEWGLTGIPPLDVFTHVIDLARDGRADPNFLQCLAMSYYLLEKRNLAEEMLARAKQSLDAQSVTIFSCWRYLWVNAKDFASDLHEMECQIKAGQELLPTYLREPALAVE